MKTTGPSLQPISPLLLPPPRLWFVVLSLLVALLFDLVPGLEALAAWRPEWLALTLLYWCAWAPRTVGITVSFALGLVMDVANATVLGQHALAYTLLAYGADYFRRRLLNFPWWQQTLFVMSLLEACALWVFAVRMMSGGALPTWPYFVTPVLGALCWPLLQYILQWPQRHDVLSPPER